MHRQHRAGQTPRAGWRVKKQILGHGDSVGLRLDQESTLGKRSQETNVPSSRSLLCGEHGFSERNGRNYLKDLHGDRLQSTLQMQSRAPPGTRLEHLNSREAFPLFLPKPNPQFGISSHARTHL